MLPKYCMTQLQLQVLVLETYIKVQSISRKNYSEYMLMLMLQSIRTRFKSKFHFPRSTNGSSRQNNIKLGAVTAMTID